MGWLASFHPSDDPRHAHHPTILQATLLQKGQEARVQQPVETVTLGLAFCMASKKSKCLHASRPRTRRIVVLLERMPNSLLAECFSYRHFHQAEAACLPVAVAN